MGLKEFYRKETEKGVERSVFAVDRNFSEIDAESLPERRADLHDHPFLLKIFHINDIHCNIYSFNDDYSTTPVFSKIVNEVEKERINSKNQSDTGVLFISAGDDSTGSPMDHLTGYDGKNFTCHPSYSAFRLAGIDATVMGNHDFDTGLQTLKKSICQDTDFPVLSANLQHNGELNDLVYPAAIIVIKGVRVGIIGITTPGQIRSREGSVFSITNPLETIEEFYSKLAPFCDSVIILSHLGNKLGSTFAAVKIMGDLELASRLKDKRIDLVIGGHTHDLLNINGLELKNIINNVPILQAGFNGLFFGKAILKISDQNSLLHTSVIPTGNLTSNRKFDSAYENNLIGVSLSLLKMPLGDLDQINEYRTLNYEIFKDSFENPMANFITDSLKYTLRAKGYSVDLSLIDGSSMIKFFNFDRKTVNTIDVYKLMPYADTVVIVTMNGKTLEDIIKANGQRVNRDNIPNIERGFLHFSKELRYTIDKKRGIVEDIFINNVPLESSYMSLFTLAMPNNVQGLSRIWEDSEMVHGNVVSGFRDVQKNDIGLYVRNELLEYIKKKGVSKKSGFVLDGRLKIK